MTTWFITGASRGFGRRLVDAALSRGDRVVAAARRTDRLADLGDVDGRLLVVPLDVTDHRQVDAAVSAAVARFGGIDVLVNNAGYGLFGSIEETTDEQFRAVFETNVFGALAVTRAVLPILRRQRSGRIIMMGSSAGFATSAGRGPYGASKFALEGIAEALRAELEPLGIAVTIVEPGSFRTEFLSGDSRRSAPAVLDDYSSTVGALLEGIVTSDGRQPGDPDRAVSALLRLADADAPPLRLQLGSDSVALVEGKLEVVRAELDAWRDVSTGTDF